MSKSRPSHQGGPYKPILRRAYTDENPIHGQFSGSPVDRRRKRQSRAPIGTFQSNIYNMAVLRGFTHKPDSGFSGVNTNRLSKASGLSPFTLRQLFSGEMPSMRALGALCDALQCQPSDLLTRIPGELAPGGLLPDDAPSDTYILPENRHRKNR